VSGGSKYNKNVAHGQYDVDEQVESATCDDECGYGREDDCNLQDCFQITISGRVEESSTMIRIMSLALMVTGEWTRRVS
jgi:hypothetical protein